MPETQQKQMMHHGSCLCGRICYTLNHEPEAPSLCHCQMCQKQHGAPFGAYSSVNWSGFEITKGAQDLVHYRSSATVTRTFCKHCGSTLQFVRDHKAVFGLAIATLDSSFSRHPESQICTSSTADWWTLSAEPVSYLELGPEEAS